jgi:hypothetical protein
MFCGKCGANIPEGSEFCPSCGERATVTTGINAPVELPEAEKHYSVKKKHKIPVKIIAPVAAVFAVIVIAVVIISGKAKPLVNKQCDWCYSSPSYCYKVDSDTNAYICPDCDSRCFYCDSKKVAKHGFNLFDMVVPLCKDCYNECYN